MKEYVELSGTPNQMVVQGTMGMQNVYKIRRVFTPVGVVDLSRNRYYYSKETGEVVSCRGRSSQATPLLTDKYNNYTFSEKRDGGFARPFKVSRNRVLEAAANIL